MVTPEASRREPSGTLRPDAARPGRAGARRIAPAHLLAGYAPPSARARPAALT